MVIMKGKDSTDLQQEKAAREACRLKIIKSALPLS